MNTRARICEACYDKKPLSWVHNCAAVTAVAAFSLQFEYQMLEALNHSASHRATRRNSTRPGHRTDSPFRLVVSRRLYVQPPRVTASWSLPGYILAFNLDKSASLGGEIVEGPHATNPNECGDRPHEFYRRERTLWLWFHMHTFVKLPAEGRASHPGYLGWDGR
jgi:hypothetical protein